MAGNERSNGTGGRIWDRFLTEQDKAHLAASAPPTRLGWGEKPALLLIDVYRSVFGDQPEPLLESIKRWPSSCGLAGWEAIERMQGLLQVARDTGIPVIHVTGQSSVPGWSDFGKPGNHVSAEGQESRRRKYEIMPQVAPLPGEVVIEKSSPSAFWGTPLAGHLNFLGVDTLVVVGESTSGCVRASVVDGRTYRYHMIVVEECVFDRHEASHAINLFDMDQKYADVLSLAEVVQHLRQRVATPALV